MKNNPFSWLIERCKNQGVSVGRPAATATVAVRQLAVSAIFQILGFLLVAGVTGFAAPLDDAIQKGDTERAKALIAEDPTILEQQRPNTDTPLHRAAARGDAELVRFMLSKGADPDASRHGTTPAWHAAVEGRGEALQALLEAGVNPNTPIRRGQLLLAEAANANQAETVAVLLEAGARADAVNPLGSTALHAAAERDAAAIVKLLTAANAPLDAQDHSGHTPLHAAFLRGDAAARVLLEAGANPNAKARSGATPLHLAALHGRESATEPLLAAGADVNSGTKAEATPLHFAALRGHAAAARKLLAAEANVQAADRDRRTPLHEAAVSGNAEIIGLLLEGGAKPDVADRTGRTPLHLAVENGQLAAIEVLARAGAGVNQPIGQRGITALHRAVEHHDPELTALLLRLGAGVDAADQWERTPLHRAARRANREIIGMLLESGADINQTDGFGWTPLDYAVIAGDPECIALMEGKDAERGAGGLHATSEVGAEECVEYLLAAQKPNGAFGPHENTYTDAAWNYPAIASLLLLGEEVPRAADALENGRTVIYSFALHPKFQGLAILGNLHRLLDSNYLESEDIGRREWALEYLYPEDMTGGEGLWRNLGSGSLRYHSVSALWNLVDGLTASGGTLSNPLDVAEFLASCQTGDGGFVNDADPADGALPQFANVVYTAHAVKIYDRLGLEIPNREKVIEWLRACQDEGGGFRASPGTGAEDDPDVYYTCLAAEALAILDAKPSDPEAAVRWVNGLQNTDGGFGDRPGWRSRLAPTFYALRALQALTGNPREAIATTTASLPPAEPIPDGKYRIWLGQHQTPPGGPEMVDALAEMKMHFAGISRGNQLFGARAYADELTLRDLHLHACLEDSGQKYRYDGNHLAHHAANYLIPAMDPLPEHRRQAWQSTLEAIREPSRAGLDWPDYRERVIDPIAALPGLFMPEAEWDMANAYRIFRDRPLAGSGYNVSQAAHFNGPDTIRRIPYRERMVTRLTILADGDSHGDVEKWRTELMAYRNVFLAETPSFEDWVDAALTDRSVCVIRDPEVPGGLTFYGPPHLVEYLKSHIQDWMWWEDAPGEAN